MDEIVLWIRECPSEDDALQKILGSEDHAWLSQVALEPRAPSLCRKAALDRMYEYPFREEVQIVCLSLIKKKDDDEEVRLTAFQVLRDLATQRGATVRTRGAVRVRSSAPQSEPEWMKEAENDPSFLIRSWVGAL